MRDILGLLRLCDFVNAGGLALPVSEWTTGTGRHIRRRAVPPFCTVAGRKDVHGVTGAGWEFAADLVVDRPRVREVVLLADVPGALWALAVASGSPDISAAVRDRLHWAIREIAFYAGAPA